MKVYLVQELHWEYNDSFYILNEDLPKRAFESFEDAKHYAIERDSEQWSYLIGMNLGKRFDAEALSSSDFQQQLKIYGFSQFLDNEPDFYSDTLWERIWGSIGVETLRKICDRIVFSDVVEVELQ